VSFAGLVDARIGIIFAGLTILAVMPTLLLFNRRVGILLLNRFDCWYILVLAVSIGLIGAFLFVDPSAGSLWGIKFLFFMPASSCFADASPARKNNQVSYHYGKIGHFMVIGHENHCSKTNKFSDATLVAAFLSSLVIDLIGLETQWYQIDDTIRVYWFAELPINPKSVMIPCLWTVTYLIGVHFLRSFSERNRLILAQGVRRARVPARVAYALLLASEQKPNSGLKRNDPCRNPATSWMSLFVRPWNPFSTELKPGPGSCATSSLREEGTRTAPANSTASS